MTLNVFGPVPSRRLGRSIGINNIPPKICSYACIYCQVGKTTHRHIKRQTFYDPQQLVDETKIKLDQLDNPQQDVDYVTIVSEGEPTLDENLGTLISGLKSLYFPVALITNGSLLWDEAVREDLADLDFLSIKVDAFSDAVWKKINRPVRQLSLDKIKDGVRRICHDFDGRLVTETMLLKDINDGKDELEAIAGFLKELDPKIAYIAAPTRPPAVPSVKAADSVVLMRAFDIFSSAGLHAEFLIGYEGNAFASTGNAKNDVLSITAVHPMRQDAVEILLRKDHASWQVVNDLIADHQLRKIEYNKNIFYTRRLQTERL